MALLSAASQGAVSNLRTRASDGPNQRAESSNMASAMAGACRSSGITQYSISLAGITSALLGQHPFASFVQQRSCHDRTSRQFVPDPPQIASPLSGASTPKTPKGWNEHAPTRERSSTATAPRDG